MVDLIGVAPVGVSIGRYVTIYRSADLVRRLLVERTKHWREYRWNSGQLSSWLPTGTLIQADFSTLVCTDQLFYFRIRESVAERIAQG